MFALEELQTFGERSVAEVGAACKDQAGWLTFCVGVKDRDAVGFVVFLHL